MYEVLYQIILINVVFFNKDHEKNKKRNLPFYLNQRKKEREVYF